MQQPAAPKMFEPRSAVCIRSIFSLVIFDAFEDLPSFGALVKDFFSSFPKKYNKASGPKRRNAVSASPLYLSAQSNCFTGCFTSCKPLVDFYQPIVVTVEHCSAAPPKRFTSCGRQYRGDAFFTAGKSSPHIPNCSDRDAHITHRSQIRPGYSLAM